MPPVDITFDAALIESQPNKGRAKKPRADTPPKLDEAIESNLPKTPAARLTKELKTIQEGLQQAFTFLGIGVSMINLYDAMVIHENAELLAKHWTKVAEQNPTVKKYLLSALQGGVWAGAITTSIAVLIPIAANHTELPDEVVQATTGIGVSLPDASLKEMASVTDGWSSNGNGSPS